MFFNVTNTQKSKIVMENVSVSNIIFKESAFLTLDDSDIDILLSNLTIKNCKINSTILSINLFQSDKCSYSYEEEVQINHIKNLNC